MATLQLLLTILLLAGWCWKSYTEYRAVRRELERQQAQLRFQRDVVRHALRALRDE